MFFERPNSGDYITAIEMLFQAHVIGLGPSPKSFFVCERAVLSSYGLNLRMLKEIMILFIYKIKNNAVSILA